MLGLLIIFLCTIFFYVILNKILVKNYIKYESDYRGVQDEYSKLLEEQTIIEKENDDLQIKVDSTTALYEITKQICGSLDEGKVFADFRDLINKYIKVGDCKFFKDNIDLSQYKDYMVLPFEIDKAPAGYLMVKQISEQDKDKFHILAHQFFLGIRRAILYQKIQDLAIMDTLTQVFNRRFLMDRSAEELERSKKFNYNLSCLMLDIDNFKTYNDRYGHLVGDAILKESSRIFKENIRQIDFIGRFGGEEFIIILTETDKEGAKFAAERIRQSMEDNQMKVYDEDLKVTVSIGISTFPDNATDLKNLIEKADGALYQAKQTGRNRVCLANN